MTIQQTASAIATRNTRLIAIADDNVNSRELAAHGIGWTVTPGQHPHVTADAAPTPRTT